VRFRIETHRPGQIQEWTLAANTKVGGDGQHYDSLAEARAALKAKREYWPKETMRLLVDGMVDDNDTDPVAWQETEPGPTRKENVLKLSTTLNVKRKVLIKKIEDTIEKARNEHNERANERKAKRQKRIENFLTLLGANTDAVLWDLDFRSWDEDRDAVTSVVLGILDELDANTTSIELALERVLRLKPFPLYGEFKPDEAATKLLSVLNAATNETLEVTTEDDLYRYL
jgi:hypothetical protein